MTAELPELLDFKDITNNNEEGPDRILEWDNDFFTTKRDAAVRLRLEKGKYNKQPISIPTLFKQTVNRVPNKIALTVERGGEWQTWTYKQLLLDVETCAKAFIHLGLEEFGVVSILGLNTPEWFIADLAAIFARGIAGGIYPTNGPDACFYCLEHSKANILVIDDDRQLQKIMPYKSQLPNLKAIVQYLGKPKEGVLSWSDLMDLGRLQSDPILDYRLKRIAINQCASLVYTSGTTGKPKAVMLSHDNIAFASLVNIEDVNFLRKDQDTLVNYLPLSHVAAQFVDLYSAIVCGGGTMYFADKDAMKGTLLSTIKYARPTVFFAVPRVWEKIYEKLQLSLSQSSFLKQNLFNWAQKIGWEYYQRRLNGNNSAPWGYTLANWLVFSKIRNVIGMDRSHSCYSAGAPLSPEMTKFFLSINVMILELYGMSESSGPHFLTNPHDIPRLGKCGTQIPGVRSKIDISSEDGSGEICMWGRNTFMGYLDNEEETKKSTEEEGWLHSGDIGTIDSGGYVQVTGRIKEILITSGGENIPAPLIELTIKEELLCISQAVLIGDERKFLSVLLTIKTAIDPDTGEPLDQLNEQALDWMKEHGIRATTVTQLLTTHTDQVNKEIDAGIQRANNRAISHAQRVQKWKILPKDFSVFQQELSPTLKVRRHVILQRYSDIIESFYV